MPKSEKRLRWRQLLLGAVVAGAVCGFAAWLWARSYPPVQNFGLIPVPGIKELASIIAFCGTLVGAILGVLAVWVGRKVF